jgi:hypothetical protein
MCVLAVRDSEHDVGMTWETMRSHRRRLPRVGNAEGTEGAHVDQRGKQYTGKRRETVSRLLVSGKVGGRECHKIA